MCGTLVWILCALQIFNACVTTSERTKEKGRGERVGGTGRRMGGRTEAGLHRSLPYSRKYWQSLNLAVAPCSVLRYYKHCERVYHVVLLEVLEQKP